MSVLRPLYLAASLVVTAATTSAVVGLVNPAFAQTARTNSSQDDLSVESQFARLSELDIQRNKLPATLHAQQWQIALLGDDRSPPRPEYLALLMAEYAKATPFAKGKIIGWVDKLAGELVQRGDGDMLLVLAMRYVKFNKRLLYANPFASESRSLNLPTNRLGKVIQSTLEHMSPREQQAFRISFAKAIGASLVTNFVDMHGEPRSRPVGDFGTAVLGFDILRKFIEMGDTDIRADTRRALEDEIKTYRFQAVDLEILWEKTGIYDFQEYTNAFLTQKDRGISILFLLAPRVTKDGARVMRDRFASDLKDPAQYEFGLYVFDMVHRYAAQQHTTGKRHALAQKMISPFWDKALEDVLTPQRMFDIYKNHYFSGDEKRPKSYTVARQKNLDPAQQEEMAKLLRDLAAQAISKPEIYYKIHADFADDRVFQKAIAAMPLAIPARHMAAHFQHLAVDYVAQETLPKLLFSVATLESMIRYDGAQVHALRMKADKFQTIIVDIARMAAGKEEEAFQVAKLVQLADNSGWRALVTKPFLDKVRTTLKAKPGGYADETLTTIWRVHLEEDARIKRWAPKVNVAPK